MKKILTNICLIYFIFCTPFVHAFQSEAVIYYGLGCPHCKNVELWMEGKFFSINILFKEIYQDEGNKQEFLAYCEDHNINLCGVPFLVFENENIIGDSPIIEFLSDYVTSDVFPDISSYIWKKSINYIYGKNIISGYDDGYFRPENKINRAELTKIVIKSRYGEISDTYANACFQDITGQEWYSKYVCFAKEKNIVQGYPDGTYGGAKNVTQPEALKIILLTFQNTVAATTSGFWYTPYLEYAENLGMYYFNKNSPALYEVSRGEVSYFMAWLLTQNNQAERSLVDQINDF